MGFEIMNYHLNREGRDPGVFPLEELHRRRVAGELTGAELVWCDGMIQWQSLDVVLQQKLPGALRPARPPAAKPKANPAVFVVVGVMLLLFFVGLVCLAIAIAKIAHRLNHALVTSSRLPGGGAQTPSALAVASQPVVWGSNTLTAADIRVRDREFCRRQYLAGYQLRGERNTNCDGLCLDFLQNWMANDYGGPADASLPALVFVSNQLAVNPACTDPLVLSVAAMHQAGMYEERQQLERAVRGFEHSRHLGYPKFYASVQLAHLLVELQTQPNRVRELDDLALQRLREAFADGSLQPGDQETLGVILVDGYASDFFTRNQLAVCTLVRDRGEAFQWLALVLNGEYHISEAWRLRGGGYANTVSPQGWQGFAKHLALARQCLTEAWQLQPGRPLAPGLMVYVSLSDSGLAEMRLWFDRTLAAQVDFYKAWRVMRWGLRPRWYGDTDAMLALGLTALNTRHFETDVPRKFFDCVGDVESELHLPVGTHVYGRADIWPHLQAMYEGYLADPTQVACRADWRSRYAVVSYLAGKHDLSARQLQALNWQLAATNLTGWGADVSVLPLEVAARTGSQAAAIAAAETSREQGDRAAAFKQYRALATGTDLDALTRSFVRDRLATLDLETRLQTHDWVDFLPTDTNFTGWFIERGNCQLNADGSLEVQSDVNGHLLYSRARLGRDFEVRGQFEVVRSSNHSFEGGLVMGLPQFETDNWYSLRIKRNQYDGDVTDFGKYWSMQRQLTPAPVNDLTNAFEFRFQHGKAAATVNHRPIFQAVAPPWTIDVAANGFHLGLGAFSDLNDTVIRYRNVQVRLP